MRFVEFRRRVQLAIHKTFRGNRYRIHGTEVTVPEHAGLELRYNLLRGRYENGEADAVRKYIPVGASVIEFGGSLGIMSKVIRGKIGAAAQHIVVEANPQLLDICRKNATAETASAKTQIVHAAVAYGVPEISFQVGHNAHVGRIGTSAGKETVVVRTTTLSEVSEKLEGNGPFCLVCDIEGAEFDVFSNEDSIFARLNMAIVEIHPDIFAERGKSRADFMALLEKHRIRVVEERDSVLVLAGPAAA